MSQTVKFRSTLTRAGLAVLCMSIWMLSATIQMCRATGDTVISTLPDSANPAPLYLYYFPDTSAPVTAKSHHYMYYYNQSGAPYDYSFPWTIACYFDGTNGASMSDTATGTLANNRAWDPSFDLTRSQSLPEGATGLHTAYAFTTFSVTPGVQGPSDLVSRQFHVYQSH